MNPAPPISFSEIYTLIEEALPDPARVVAVVTEVSVRLLNDLSVDELSKLLHTTQSHIKEGRKHYLTLQIIQKIVSNSEAGKMGILKMREVDAYIKTGEYNKALKAIDAVPEQFQAKEKKAKRLKIVKLLAQEKEPKEAKLETLGKEKKDD